MGLIVLEAGSNLKTIMYGGAMRRQRPSVCVAPVKTPAANAGSQGETVLLSTSTCLTPEFEITRLQVLRWFGGYYSVRAQMVG